MNTLITIAALFLSSPGAPVSRQAPVSQPVFRQWQVANATKVEIDVEYELHNTRRRQLNQSSQLGYKVYKSLRHADRDDVSWAGTTGGHFIFRRANANDHRSISSGEHLALYNTKVRKYMLGAQTFMSSIIGDWKAGHFAQDFSKTPSYEWIISERVGADFVLYNTVRKRNLVFGEKATELPPNGSVTLTLVARIWDIR